MHQIFYLSFQLYDSAITVIKISILLSYRKIFSIGRLRSWIRIVGIFVVAWFLADNLVFAFQGTPVRKAWNVERPGHCFNVFWMLQFVQAFNVALDAVIFRSAAAGCLPTMAPLPSTGMLLKNVSSILQLPFISRSATSRSGDFKANPSRRVVSSMS